MVKNIALNEEQFRKWLESRLWWKEKYFGKGGADVKCSRQYLSTPMGYLCCFTFKENDPGIKTTIIVNFNMTDAVAIINDFCNFDNFEWED